MRRLRIHDRCSKIQYLPFKNTVLTPFISVLKLIILCLCNGNPLNLTRMAIPAYETEGGEKRVGMRLPISGSNSNGSSKKVILKGGVLCVQRLFSDMDWQLYVR